MSNLSIVKLGKFQVKVLSDEKQAVDAAINSLVTLCTLRDVNLGFKRDDQNVLMHVMLKPLAGVRITVLCKRNICIGTQLYILYFVNRKIQRTTINITTIPAAVLKAEEYILSPQINWPEVYHNIGS